MLPSRLLALILLVCGCAQTGRAWDSGELEIFDLVEELGTSTFYQLLDIQQDATSAEVRRAYRKLSLRYHPDKTSEEGAEEKFRQVASVAEILRDDEKRAIYDRVLVEGLPSWRQPVFYYRQVRRMGTVELVLAVSLIGTLVHYGFLCAVFLEQYYQAEVATAKRSRRRGKKSDAAAAAPGDEQSSPPGTPFPGPLSILPFAVARRLATFARDAPSLYRAWQQERREAREHAELALAEEQRRESEARDEAERAAELRQRRVQYRLKQKQEHLQDAAAAAGGADIDWGRVPNAAEEAGTADGNGNDGDESGAAAAATKRPWSEEEVTALTRAFLRFPGGTLSRWEKIAGEVGRPVADVTAQIKLMKNRVVKAPSSTAGGSLEVSKRAAQSSTRLCRDITVRTGEAPAAADDVAQWGQDEQRLLEAALARFGRDASDRWERVAAAVPGKSKAECVARFKHIVTQVRQRKTTTTSTSTTAS